MSPRFYLATSLRSLRYQWGNNKCKKKKGHWYNLIWKVLYSTTVSCRTTSQQNYRYDTNVMVTFGTHVNYWKYFPNDPQIGQFVLLLLPTTTTTKLRESTNNKECKQIRSLNKNTSLETRTRRKHDVYDERYQ